MKEFLSIDEVANYFGVDYKTIYRLVKQAEIPAGKVGGVYRIRRQDIEAYYERQLKTQTEQSAEDTHVKCGRCLRLVAPYEIAGTCGVPGCDEPICRTCWEDDPNHRCRAHILSREARLRQAQAQHARGEIPLLLTSVEAHRRQLLYLGRVEAKLREQTSIVHPRTSRPVRVADWDAIETRSQDLERVREAMGSYLDEAESGPLPTNPRYLYQLADDLLLELTIYSDLAAHVKQGFVTQPTSETQLLDMLTDAIGRAEASNSLIVLDLGATAGWDDDAVALIEGDRSRQRPFYHRLVAPILADLAEDRLFYNHSDGRLDWMASLLSPEMSIDVVQKLMGAIEEQFSQGRTGLPESEVRDWGWASETEVETAFERLAATNKYVLKDGDKRERLLERRTV